MFDIDYWIGRMVVFGPRSSPRNTELFSSKKNYFVKLSS